MLRWQEEARFQSCRAGRMTKGSGQVGYVLGRGFSMGDVRKLRAGGENGVRTERHGDRRR